MRAEMPGGEAKRQSHVGSEINELQKVLDQLEDTLGRARQRFSAVIYVPPPKEEKATCEVDKALVPLAHEIRMMRYRARAAVVALQEIIDNCEL